MLESLEEQFPDLPLLPQIPLSVRSAESAAERTSVLHYMPRSPVATAYRAVATWIETNGGDASVPPQVFVAVDELHV
jgi:chromosome partitioning protein